MTSPARRPGTLLAAASLEDGLGLLLVTGLACTLPVLLVVFCPCHILMPDDLRGPMMPVRPGRLAEVGESCDGESMMLMFSRESGVSRFSLLPFGLEL